MNRNEPRLATPGRELPCSQTRPETRGGPAARTTHRTHRRPGTNRGPWVLLTNSHSLTVWSRGRIRAFQHRRPRGFSVLIPVWEDQPAQAILEPIRTPKHAFYVFLDFRIFKSGLPKPPRGRRNALAPDPTTPAPSSTLWASLLPTAVLDRYKHDPSDSGATECEQHPGNPVPVGRPHLDRRAHLPEVPLCSSTAAGARGQASGQATTGYRATMP
jgi:hypothetical protein